MKLKKVNDAYVFECIAKDEKVAKDAGFFKHPVKGYLFTKDINTARKLFQYVDLTDTILYNELKINSPTVIKPDAPEQIDYTKAVLVITYDFRKTVFVANISYEYKEIAKDLGFKFSFDEYKQWETTDISIIQKIIETDSIYKKIITDDAHNQYEHLFKIRENKIRESLKKHSDIHVPKPEGLLKDYFPFQKAGIEFAEKRNYKCLIFDEMRLGKTCQAIGCINKTLKEFYLITCPLSAMGIWRSFLKEWLIEDYDIKLVRAEFPKELKRKTIFIITYGMLYKYVQNILEIGIDFIIADEVHKVGKKKSRQGTAFYEIADKMTHNLYLSGTPFDNIYEAFYMLRSVGFSEAKNQYEFAKKYCNDGYGNWGKKFSSNMDELNTKLREEVMIRRLRSEVYPELPQKTRSIYRPSLDYAELFFIKEQQALEFGDIKNLKSEFGESIGESVKLEKYISTKKVKHTVEFAKALLEDTDKIIIFAHYIESQNEIFEHLKEFNPVMIQGGDSPNHRDNVCSVFDKDPDVRVAVLSLTGASDAVAFPAANGVIMHDTHWKPLFCMQAEDRPLGVNHKEMLPIYYLVIEGTIDMYKTQVMVHKLDIVQKAIDTPDAFKGEDVDQILKTPVSMKEIIDMMVDGE